MSPAIEGVFGTPADDPDLAPARVVTAAVIGGTASELGGGKFSNGAVTAAFSRAFNDEMGEAHQRRESAQLREMRRRAQTSAEGAATLGGGLAKALTVALSGGPVSPVAGRAFMYGREAIAFGRRALALGKALIDRAVVTGMTASTRIGANPPTAVPAATEFATGFTPALPPTTPISAFGALVSQTSGISTERLRE